jgi:hypothetical protein
MANLLVVESDQDIGRLVGIVLYNAGHHVVDTLRSSAKLDPGQLGPVDLILCDVGFLNDADLAGIGDLKRLFPGAKIVGLSAGIHGINPDQLVKTSNRCTRT